MISDPKAVAYIIDCDISERRYRKTRKLANPKGKAKRFPKYEKVQKFRDEKCMPKSDAIKTPSDDCIFVNMEDVLHHQASRLTAPMQERMLFLKDSKNAKFSLYWEYGADGLSGFKRRKKVWFPPMKWGNSSLFASTGALVGLTAHFPDGTSEILEENEAVNSPAGSIPFRYGLHSSLQLQNNSNFKSKPKDSK